MNVTTSSKNKSSIDSYSSPIRNQQFIEWFLIFNVQQITMGHIRAKYKPSNKKQQQQQQQQIPGTQLKKMTTIKQANTSHCSQ